MIPQRWDVIIHRLHAKAHEDEIRWTEAPEDKTFAVHFPNHSILLTRDYNGIKVRLVQGAYEVDTWLISEGMTGYSVVESIWLMARRKVYKVEQVLKELLEELRRDTGEV